MRASIVDLRYKMNDILKALDRNEEVTVLYRGEERGVIIPIDKKTVNSKKVEDHPFFGSDKNNSLSVTAEMKKIRKRRYHDL